MLLSLFLGCAGLSVKSLTNDRVPLFRVSQQGERLYTPVKLPDGEIHYFILDTGASVSAMSLDIAESLGLEPVPQRGILVGVSGYSTWASVEVPSLSIGKTEINDSTFAVGVEGLPRMAGAVPISGLLGNNVLSRFVVDIDYRSNTLQLHDPDEFTMPDDSVTATFDGSSFSTNAALRYTTNNDPKSSTITVKVDTGSRGLLLNESHVPSLATKATSTVNNIKGIGNNQQNLSSEFIQSTMKTKVDSIQIGEHPFVGPFDATILQAGPRNMAFVSLLGHQVFDRKRLILNYSKQQMALIDTDTPDEHHDLHGHRLSVLQWGPKNVDSVSEMVSIHYTMDQIPEAISLLKNHLRKTDDIGLKVSLSRLHRMSGHFDLSLNVLNSISPEVLLQSRVWLEYANLNELNDNLESLEPYETLYDSETTSYEASLALSDVHYLRGNYELSNAYLLESVSRAKDPNSFLFRRARSRYILGDLAGAIAHLRKLLVINPYGGQELWFYALIAKGTEFHDLALKDIRKARSKLYVQDGALDFFAAAFYLLGDNESSEIYQKAGIERDCEQPSDHVKRNCLIWYQAMVNQITENDLQVMKELTDAFPTRSDFLDTYAVALAIYGNKEEAMTVSKAAALRDPSDIYMLWQLEAIPRFLIPDQQDGL